MDPDYPDYGRATSNSESEPCSGLVNYVMIWIKEPFIKNEKSKIDVLIFWVNKI